MSSEVPPGREHLYMNVEHPEHPVAAAQEADASDAARKYAHYVIRGPLFGVAAQGEGDGRRWRVISAVNDGSAQESRDGLNSYLWFRALNDTDDRSVRRELLAAVARLETDPVNEVTAAGTRYRIVRCDEFLYRNDEGPEPPRPTDEEPGERNWDLWAKGPRLDDGFVIDHIAATSAMTAAERLALMGLRYRSPRYPAEVRDDSRRAVVSHAGVVLLPPAFRVLESTGTGWEPASAMQAGPHSARKALVYLLTQAWPVMYDLDEAGRASYARAAREFQAAGEADVLRLDDGRDLCIARMRRLVRMGPDGPETARPSDEDPYGPTRMHPPMDEHGTVTHES
ncbi:DUF5954 family protein [Streptomyces sp. NPDC051567]|uniref:DUF5954 family protein n=1 Tax=Streptomyces sp. NPDC051567 TaxID=3365660 RepID=UPI00378FF45B